MGIRACSTKHSHTHTQKASEWLTAGTTASSLSCATCTTSTTTVSWTRTTSSAWPSATLSSRPRASGTRECTKRTRKSWPTWNEVADLADFNKDGEVSVEEFNKGIEMSCKGKSYAEFPQAFKFFIDSSFRTIDVDGDGSVGLDEYRSDCVKRMAYKSIKDLDAAYEKLLTEDDKKKGGITLERYQELYAHFIGNPDETCNGCFLFGPLEVIE